MGLRIAGQILQCGNLDKGFQGSSVVRNLPAMLETRVWNLGQEDPLEKGMATRSSIPVWRIPGTEESGGLQNMGLQTVGYDWVTNSFIFIFNLDKRSSGEVSGRERQRPIGLGLRNKGRKKFIGGVGCKISKEMIVTWRIRKLTEIFWFYF